LLLWGTPEVRKFLTELSIQIPSTRLSRGYGGRLASDLVSIITPAYRAAEFVGATIQSVQTQDHEVWEMLIVDDCSPDDTCARIEAFSIADPRVRLIRQSQNAGPAAARNVALAKAQGRYIAFLDSDDLWMPNKLSTQLRFMQQNNAAVTYTEFRRITQDGVQVGRRVAVPRKLTYHALLCNTAIVTSSVILDRDKTGPVSMPDAPYDDYALWLRLLRSGHIAWGLQADLVRYRMVAGSVSRSKRTSALRVWRTYRDVESLGIIRSAWAFANYAVRGWLKYKSF
jgi:teichuronic acid biosynthesis glycosyltransferase TuaG